MRPSTRLAAWLEARATARDGGLATGFVWRAVLLGYALFCATYLPINHWSVDRPASVLFLPGEERLPFVPAAEYLYVWTYVLPLALPRLLPGPREFARLTLAFWLTLAVAYGTYLAFPVYFERPALEVDSLATWLLALEYLDPSYNHFPSLHVALSWLVFLACRPRLPWPRLGAVFVLGVSLSTLFVKQHYLVDVLYGFALALLAWWLAGRAAGCELTRPSHHEPDS